MPVKLFVGPSEDKSDGHHRASALRRRQGEGLYHRRRPRRHRPGICGAARLSHQRLAAGRYAARRRNGSGSAAAGCWSTATPARPRSLKLPDFDPFYSQVSWYRDYAAYCGIPSSGERVNAPGLRDRQQEAAVSQGAGQEHAWATRPTAIARRHHVGAPAGAGDVSPQDGDKFTVNVSGRFADEATDNDSDEQ